MTTTLFVTAGKELQRDALQKDGTFTYVYGGHLQIDGMIAKEFRSEHVHKVGEQCQMGRCGKRMMRAKLLSRLISGKVRSSMDYLPTEIMKDLELQLGLRMTYMQAWRGKEYVRLFVMGRPVDHYKLLPWMCAAIERGNLDSRAFVELAS